jgi:drug/metabolite transporter (DMT)-like permease
VDPFVIALVAISAALHVAWNVRLKTAGDPLRAATVGMLAATIGIVPVGVGAWIVAGRPALPVEGVLLGLLSGVIEAGYFILLSAAYRRGDLSVVYPIARGTAPLLALAIGVGLFGERLGVVGSFGVVALLAGFLVMQQPWRALRWRGGAGPGLDPAIPFALATGVTIATYSAIDRLGTRLIDPLPYAAILWVTTSAVLVLWMRFVAGGHIFAGGRAEIRSAAVGGWLTLGAYVLILWALSVAPLSGVAPLRESATVFAAAWGSVRLGEAVSRRETWRRIGASALIVGGAILLAVAGR